MNFKLILATITVLVTVEVSEAAPTCSPTEDGTYYPHEDCTKYYVCSVGQLIIQECAGGTYWNPLVNQCDHEYNVPECIGGTRPPDGSTVPPTSTTTTTETTTTTSVAPTTTTPKVTTTTTTTPRTTTTGLTTPLPNGCPPVGVDKIPYPGSCVLYFICIDGTPHLTNCTDGLYFNPTIKDCDLPQNVDCIEPTTRPPTTARPATTTTRPPTTTTRPQTTTTRPQTTTTRPQTTTTRPQSTTEEPTISPTTEETPFACPAKPDFIYMAHPTDCTRFYACESGVFQRVYSCGTDRWFNYSLQSCVAPWSETCPLE